MCERYSLGKTKKELEERFEAELLEPFQPRYNIGPTQLVPVITNESKNGFSHFYWGTTPHFSKNKPVSPRLVHARSESLSEKAAYKNAFQFKRCLIPADGFYLWKSIGRKTKTPYRFTLLDEGIFAFAGLWDEYENDKGGIDHTFLLLTTTSNKKVGEIEERMPLILSRDHEKKWLDRYSSKEELLDMFIPFPEEEMTSYTVSPLVNQIKEDSPAIIRKTFPMDQFGNYTLFG